MPTPILEDRSAIAALDKSNALGSVESLAKQAHHAWESLAAISFTPKTPIKNVVVAAMGGSALGADVAKHLFKDRITVPFEVVNGYHLPAYVDESTLVVLASYSGGTEETLSCAQEAIAHNAQAMFICAGGELQKIGLTNNWSGYIIDPQFNPSNQPRMAIGYAVIGLLGLLSKAGVFALSEAEVGEVIATIVEQGKQLSVEVPSADNQAKLLAFECLERRPVFVVSDFLTGAAHVATNQFNENAKIFADYKVVPEINHHLMEGLQFPKSNALSHFFVFFTSDLYESRIQKRMTLTQEVVTQNEIETFEVRLKSPTKLTQTFELITLMAYTNFYLTMLEGIDPSPIPFVDWFKDQLK